MPQYSAATSSRKWLTSNLLVESLRARGVPIARVQYEQLVRDPGGDPPRGGPQASISRSSPASRLWTTT